MAVRREQVIVDLTDNVTPGLARMAVAAGLADRALKGMGGTSVSTGRDLDRTATGVDKVGTSTRKSGPDIDKFSGRLRTLGDAALTLGPAIIPLGAGTIPVLTAALAGLTAAAGGIGVAVLAFHGLGDGLKALNDYQLEPTADNLQALRLEMEKLGPDGAHLVRFLDDLSPAMKDLQNVARAGIFPGVEDGITDLMTRLPEVRKIVNRLSQEMGELAAESGSALGGPEFDAFFQYLKTDARPTLEAFAHSAGNVALGAANMLVAFAPLNRDFTGGLESATKAFADWSAGLDDNESFQDFLSYVRESGPQVVEFLGALVGALTGLISAAAPFGSVVLPALTGVAKAFATIADSPIGPGLYAAAAAMVAFSRASKIAESSSARFTKSWEGMSKATKLAGGIGGIGLLATSMTDLDDKVGLANTAMFSMAGLMVGGPWGLAIGAGVGAVADFTAAQGQMNDELERTRDIAREGTDSQKYDEYERLRHEIEETDGSLKGLLFGTQAQEFALAELGDSMQGAGGISELFARDMGLTAKQMEFASNAAQDFSGALAGLNGWFDQRAAVRGYRDAIKELAKSLKDGFQPKDVEGLDAAGRSILQVAAGIKDPALREDFLAGARASLENLAEKSGPKAATALQRVIDKFDDEGLTHPKPIQITADERRAAQSAEDLKRTYKTAIDIIGNQKAKPTIDADANPFLAMRRQVAGGLSALDRTTAKPKVSVDPGNSFSVLGGIRAELARIVSKTVTVTTRRVGGATQGMFADGGYTGPGAKHEPAGIVHRGEVVIPQNLVRRDWSMLSSRYGNLPGFAGGGVVGRYAKNYDGGYMTDWGQGYGSRGGDDPDSKRAKQGIHILVEGLYTTAKYLKALNKELDKQQKAYDKAKSAHTDAISRRDSISSGIQSGLAGDSIWADVPAKGGVWAAGSTPGGKATPASAMAALEARKDRARRLVAAINTLKGKGVEGAALLEIIGDGDVERAEAMAALDVGSLSGFAGAVNESNAALAAAGLAGGNAIEGDNIRETGKRLDRLHDDLQQVKQAINQAEKAADKASDKNAKDVKDGVNGAAHHGHKRGK